MRLIAGLLALVLMGVGAQAEGIGRKAPTNSRVAAPAWQQPAPSYVDVWKPSFEVGALGGYAFTEEIKGQDFDDFVYGLYAGVNARSGAFGFGIEADAMRFAAESDLADWLMSIRGRGGYYITENIMAYGTAGWAFETDAGDNGLVGGLGVQMETGRVVTRVEWLHYDLDTDVQMVRAGLGIKF